jgi:DNA-binding NarL/FixJ family response regulator
MTMAPITVLLAEDHKIVREGLRALVKLETDIEIVGEAQNGLDAVKLARDLKPDVVLMDISMPLMNGIEATKQILKYRPTCKVIILSAHSDDAYIENVMSLGASGFLSKQSARSVLVMAIKDAHNGKTVFSPEIARRVNHHRMRAKVLGDLPPKENFPPLTIREKSVLKLIAEGLMNKEAADRLQVSIKTIDHHRQNIAAKLNIHETAGLTRYAVEIGLIEPHPEKPC